jgi:type I restriction enzyme S subunit
MKPSGIDWLGDMPAHWEIKRLKHLRLFLTSGSRGWAAYYSDAGSTFLRMTNVTKSGIELDLSDVRYVDVSGTTEGARTALQPGDVLITITAELGAIAIARDQHSGAYINQHLALFRPNSAQVIGDFLAHSLTCDALQHQLVASGYGGTKQGLGFDQINELHVALPPLEEQGLIATHIAHETRYLDNTSMLLRASKKRLLEYRSALISAAVTGSLDLEAA